MKTLRFLLILLPSLAMAQLTPELTPKEVTIFLKGAQLTSEATVNLPQGSSNVLLTDLSPDINSNSIQVSGLKNVTIQSINYDIDYLKKAAPAKLKNLQKQADEKNKAISLLNNKIDGLKKEKSLLENNGRLNSDAKTQSAPLQKLKAYASYIGNRVEQINNKVYDDKQKINEINKNLNDLYAEIKKLQSGNNEKRGEIKLILNAPRPSTVKLVVKYNVNNAGWFPTYDIKAKDTDAPLAFHYKANVYQETGSNWNNVGVTLSTGDPSLNTEKPTVNPHYLNFIRTYSPRHVGDKLKENSLNEEVITNGYKSATRALQGEVSGLEVTREKTPQTIKSENVANVQFKIAKKYSIVSSSETTIVEIDKFDIPAEYDYYSAPLLNPQVYLTAKLNQWEGNDILPGDAKIYFNGSYAGTTFLDPQKTEKELVISLGIDPKIVVERKQIDNLKDKSFFGGTRIIDRKYEINLKNNKSSAVEINLLDRIPISQNKEIKVDKRDYGDADFDKKTGVVTWKVNLPAGETAKRKISYEVKYPKDQSINLN